MIPTRCTMGTSTWLKRTYPGGAGEKKCRVLRTVIVTISGRCLTRPRLGAMLAGFEAGLDSCLHSETVARTIVPNWGEARNHGGDPERDGNQKGKVRQRLGGADGAGHCPESKGSFEGCAQAAIASTGEGGASLR